MDSFIPPEPGANLHNAALADIFGCSTQGGMRRSKRTNTLVIVSNHVESQYDDRWVGDVLHYTGMGLYGHQSLDRSQNRTLNNSASNGVAIHLFEVFKSTEYTYIGEVELAGNPYKENQLDALGQQRLVWIFPVRLKSGELPAIPDATLGELTKRKEKQLQKLSDAEIAELAQRTERIVVGRRTTKTVQFQRSLWIAEHAKRRAKGKCELCLEPAPFKRKNGAPYLETHHIKWLARGGADTVENTVALCPNCHRKMHQLDSPADIKLLKKRLTGDDVSG